MKAVLYDYKQIPDPTPPSFRSADTPTVAPHHGLIHGSQHMLIIGAYMGANIS